MTTNGYLVDAAGNIIDHKGRLMFPKADLDEQNQIPLPFGVERFNFNPFDLQGDLAWKKPTDPHSFTKATKNGRLIDSKGRQINKAGFLIDSDGNILNRHGDIRFSAG